MKNYSNEEIKEECVRIWGEEHQREYMMGWDGEENITVELNTPEKVEIRLSCMYGAPSMNSIVMGELTKFFDTKNINDDDQFADGGCETCDYGSSYGYTLTVRPD